MVKERMIAEFVVQGGWKSKFTRLLERPVSKARSYRFEPGYKRDAGSIEISVLFPIIIISFKAE
jgi:hypothetical protein